MKSKLSIFAFVSLFLSLLTVAHGFTPQEYGRKLPLSVPGYTGESALTGFPVLVRLSESIEGFLYTDFASPSGADLVFAAEDGTVFPHEIDTWDPTGESLVWVRIPTLTPHVSFTAYYGNESVAASIADGTAPNPAVWDQYYGVWHFGAHETDATGLGTSFTGAGYTPEAGRVGAAYTVAYGRNGICVPNVITNADGSASTSFTLSAWVKPKRSYASQNSRLFSSKPSHTANGFEFILSSGKLLMRGNSNARTYTNEGVWGRHFAIDAWTHVAGVYNQTVAKDYFDGVLDGAGTGDIQPITATTAISFGNYGGGSSRLDPSNVFNGSYDEVRFYRGEASADWIAAEYATVAQASFVAVEAAQPVSADTPIFADAPTLTAASDGTFTFAVTLASGTGDIYAILTDLSTGTATTNLIASAVDASEEPQSISGPITPAPGAMYSFSAYGRNAHSAPSRRWGESDILAAEVSIAATQNAVEQTLENGCFTVTRPNTPAATAAALTIPYTLSGTALLGETFAPLAGTVTIPAGEDTATIEVTPLFCPDVDDDTTLTLTLLPAVCPIGTPDSATLTIVNSAENQFVRYVSTEGDDLYDGLTPDRAKRTLENAYLSLVGVATTDHPGTIYVAPGTYIEVAHRAVYSALRITEPVRIIGSTGNPADVTLRATPEVSAEQVRVLYLGHPLASAQYLTLTGGNQSDGVCAYIDPNGGEILDCVITNVAYSTWNGHGALYMRSGRVARTHFVGNSVVAQGSALYMLGGTAENCLFTDNTSNSGHTVYLTDTATLRNCTIVRNTGNGGSSVSANGRDVRVINCAIFGNTVTDNVQGHVWGGNAPSAFIRCATEIDIPGSIDCIVGDPSFVNAAEGDFHLLPSSCCIDAGTNAAPYSVTSSHDLDGNPRIAGAAVDIGCYENQQTGISVSFALAVDKATLPATITLTPATLGFPADASLTYTWDLGDGTVRTTSAPDPLVHTYTQVGDYTPVLSVSDGTTTATYFYPTLLHLIPQTLYVNGSNPNAAIPYDQPEIGAASVAEAVAYAVNGSTIRILPGTLLQTQQTIVDKDIQILGDTGNPNDVILANPENRINANRSRIFILNHPKALIANLTMTRGSANENNAYGANVYIKDGGGTVSNCVIRSGRSQHWNSHGAGAYLLNGLLTHTEITGEFITEPNTSASPNAAGVVVHLGGAKARMENCLIHDITIAQNNNSNHSAGPIVSVHAGTIVNCTIAPNCTMPNVTSTNSSFSAYNGGSAVYCSANGYAYNCVATGLVSTNGTLTPFSGTAANFSHCVGDSDTPWPGTHCLTATPNTLYINPSAQNYRPNSSGPLVDAGLNSASSASLDLRGNPRILGSNIDIGCYEANLRHTLILFQ